MKKKALSLLLSLALVIGLLAACSFPLHMLYIDCS